MKKGDVIYDADLGMTAIILDVLKTTAHTRGAIEFAYTVLYDDGSVKDICDYEVSPIEELIYEGR